MPTYTVNVDIRGTAILSITADDEDDAMSQAEDLLNDSDIRGVKMGGRKITIQIGEADPQEATEEK